MGDGEPAPAAEVWRVVWAEAARNDVERIAAYLEMFNPGAAIRISAGLAAAAEALAENPDRGRPGPRGSRELVTVRPYIIRYRVNAGARTVRILRVRHGARRPDSPSP